jgi:hypothetical protein
LDTRLGHVVLARWRVRKDSQTSCLLDRLLGLPRYSRASPGVEAWGSELTRQMPYRQASAALSQELGTRLSAQSVHAWVGAMGQAVEEQELEREEKGPAVPRDVVVAEWDDVVTPEKQDTF